MYYLSLTASRSMRMTAIQMKAVRKRRRRMVVRGNTSACIINIATIADPDPTSSALLAPCIRDGSGSGINNPDHISECLESIFFGLTN